MIRWRSLLPRLLVLSLFAVSAYCLATPISRALFLRATERVVGAEVQLGNFEISLSTGQVQITNWQLADSREPSRNLFQAKQAMLQIQMDELWQRRWVIERAFFKGVQFGTPRSSRGNFPHQPQSADLAMPVFERQRNPAAPLVLEDWWTETKIILDADPRPEMETVKVTQDLERWWPAELSKFEDNAAELQQQSAELRRELGKLQQNPLRDRRQAELTAQRAQQLAEDVLAARKSLDQLWKNWEKDKQRLSQASLRDQQTMQLGSIDLSVGAVEINPQQLSQLLLKVYAEEWTAATLDWLQCFQAALPAVKTKFEGNQKRGFDVRFREYPPLLIKKTELTGAGNLNGRLFEFGGQINHLSTAPKWVAEPVTFSLQSQGDNATRLSGIIDRRGSQPCDTLFIACPRLTTEPRSLGQTDSILVNWSAGIMALHGQIHLQAEQLRGSLHLQPSEMQLQVQQIAPLSSKLVGELPLVLQSINRTLQNVDGFDLSIELSGSLQDPRFRLTSDLGALLSDAVTGALEKHQKDSTSLQLAALQALRQQNLSLLETVVLARYAQLKRTLERDLVQVAELRTLAQQTSQNSGQIR